MFVAKKVAKKNEFYVRSVGQSVNQSINPSTISLSLSLSLWAPWLFHTLKLRIRHRNSLFRKAKRSGCELAMALYRQYTDGIQAV